MSDEFMNEVNIKGIWIGVAVVIAAFLVGRMTKSCDGQVITERVVTRDTIISEKTADMVWRPKGATMTYAGRRDGTKSNTRMSAPSELPQLPPAYGDTVLIRDSVRNGDVGLTFEHLVRGEILESKYKVKYPEIRINTQTTERKVVRMKNAFGLGGMTMIPLVPGAPIEIAPVISYRYDKLQVMGGYGVLHRGLIIGIIREF